MSIAIFISHKHTDREIANVIKANLKRWNIPADAIYQSSDPTGAGPIIGNPLAQDLKKALYQANAVFLVYTFADENWDYCMWECGVATDPNPDSPNTTKIIVFQATKDIPRVFNNEIRINITEKDDILKFTTQFHTQEGFYLKQSAYASDIEQVILKERSNKLYEDLNQVIPPHSPEERSRWDFFTLKLNSDSLQRINQEQSDDSKINTIQTESEVVYSFGAAPKHFNFDNFTPNLKFFDLIEQWKRWRNRRLKSSEQENIPQEWIEELCREMLRAIEKESAEPIWQLMKTPVYPTWWFYPIVNHVKIDRNGSMEFQIYMYRLPGTLPNNPT